MESWFREHNYDVEIQGELFVPKNLNWTKINLDVLNRQRTISTKSVQINHVDAPGQLRVTVGSLQQSIGENEDIKELRRNVESLTTRINQLESLQKRVTNLEPLINGVGQLEPQKANSTAQHNKLIDRLLHSGSPNAGSTCSELSTNYHISGAAPIGFLAVHDIRCPYGQFLTRFQVHGNWTDEPDWADKPLRYDYTCCYLI